MASEPIAQNTEVEVVERYSKTNPPPSIEIALTTIEDLEVTAGTIEAQLDHPDPRKFQDHTAYSGWRNRATVALACTRREIDFLKKWVGNQRNPTPKPVIKTSSSDELHTIVEKIRTRARELSEPIRDSYTVRYNAITQPENVSQAQERMTYLIGVKNQLQASFSEITAEWTQYPLRRGDMPGIKAPLQRLLSMVETEIGVVKGYIRANSSSVHDWRGVCVRALTRAVEGGFVLTSEEQLVLDQMKNSAS